MVNTKVFNERPNNLKLSMMDYWLRSPFKTILLKALKK